MDMDATGDHPDEPVYANAERWKGKGRMLDLSDPPDFFTDTAFCGLCEDFVPRDGSRCTELGYGYAHIPTFCFDESAAMSLQAESISDIMPTDTTCSTTDEGQTWSGFESTVASTLSSIKDTNMLGGELSISFDECVAQQYTPPGLPDHINKDKPRQPDHYQRSAIETLLKTATIDDVVRWLKESFVSSPLSGCVEDTPRPTTSSEADLALIPESSNHRMLSSHVRDSAAMKLDAFVLTRNHRPCENRQSCHSPRKQYECPYDCGYSGGRGDDLFKHLQHKWPQTLMYCPFCADPPIFHRHCKFWEHLHSMHQNQLNEGDACERNKHHSELCTLSMLEYNAPFPRSCPFVNDYGTCPTTFDSWEEFKEHLLKHFRNKISDGPWNLRYWPRGPSKDDDDDNDDRSRTEWPPSEQVSGFNKFSNQVSRALSNANEKDGPSKAYLMAGHSETAHSVDDQCLRTRGQQLERSHAHYLGDHIEKDVAIIAIVQENHLAKTSPDPCSVTPTVCRGDMDGIVTITKPGHRANPSETWTRTLPDRFSSPGNSSHRNGVNVASLIPAASWSCPFSFLGCEKTLLNISEWNRHCQSHFCSNVQSSGTNHGSMGPRKSNIMVAKHVRAIPMTAANAWPSVLHLRNSKFMATHVSSILKTGFFDVTPNLGLSKHFFTEGLMLQFRGAVYFPEPMPTSLSKRLASIGTEIGTQEIATNPHVTSKCCPPSAWCDLHMRLENMFCLPSRNPRFIGRESLLDDIHQNLNSERSQTPIVLSGMAGVGKTQIALEYAYRHRGEYDAVLWVRTNDEGGLDHNIDVLQGALQHHKMIRSWSTALEILCTYYESSGKVAWSPERLITSALEESAQESSAFKWLLILDSVCDLDRLNGIEFPDRNGSILVTSRDRRNDYASLDPEPSHPPLAFFDVDEFSTSEAEEALVKWSGLDQPLRYCDVQALCEHIGNWPLALVSITAFIRATHINIQELLHHFDEMLRDWSREFVLAKAAYSHSLPKVVSQNVRRDLKRLCARQKDSRIKVLEWLLLTDLSSSIGTEMTSPCEEERAE